MEFSEARNELSAAAAKTPGESEEIVSRLPAVMRRARRIAEVLAGAQLLWVDDVPLNNLAEIRAFRSLGVAVDVVTSTDGAMRVLTAYPERYDLVLSDMRRGDRPEAGLELAAAVQARHPGLAVILYTGKQDSQRGASPGVSAVTTRPDELFQAVFDVLDRKRG